MSKTLKTLIKLHKQYLDEKRRDLVELEVNRENHISFIKNLDRELEMEKQFATTSPEKSYTFSNYIKQVRKKEQEAQIKINGLDKEIEVLSLQISNAFGDLKKYEIMKNIKEEAELAEEMKRLQIDLDEIGGTAHHRKEDSA